MVVGSWPATKQDARRAKRVVSRCASCSEPTARPAGLPYSGFNPPRPLRLRSSPDEAEPRAWLRTPAAPESPLARRRPRGRRKLARRRAPSRAGRFARGMVAAFFGPAQTPGQAPPGGRPPSLNRSEATPHQEAGLPIAMDARKDILTVFPPCLRPASRWWHRLVLQADLALPLLRMADATHRYKAR